MGYYKNLQIEEDLSSNYAFTLQIPAFKKVNFDNKYVPFKKLDGDSQMTF